MATSLTHKYIPRIEQTEENLFTEEYYSSTDTKIYMDDTEQTEIAYISYSLLEQLKPLYGYASRTFDDIAIGSRIVTGAFKVPIKNPEAQTPMNTIIERGKHKTLEDYNESQDDLKDTVEWITKPSQDTGPTETVHVESDEMFEYRSKLINLGYDLDYNSSTNVLKKEIKKFQNAHGLEVTGILDDATKDAIDNAMSSSSGLKTKTLPAGTKIYLGCAKTFDVVKTLSSSEEVFVIDDDYDSGWMYIMTKDGTEGYVQL